MEPRRRERLVLSGALVASGAAALIYESTWGRMLHRVFGVSDWAIATVLAAFFLGMGLGAALGGRLAARFPNPIRTYAALEGFVALWAVASIALVPGIHRAYAGFGAGAGLATLTALRFVLALAVLLPPTIAMGATLPVLVRRFEDDADWRRDATWLYTINTLGAALGAGATGFFLLPTIGGRASILTAAALSCGAAALALSGLGVRRMPAPERWRARDRDEAVLAPGLVIALAFGSGLLSLAGEVVFTRLLRTIIQGTSQAFAAMLVTYLLGIALGSLIARARARDALSTLGRFGGAQLLAAALVGLGIAIAPWLPRLVGLARGDDELVPHELPVILGISMLALLPIAIAVGTGLPYVMAMTGSSGGARTAGRVLAANTLGGLVGSLVAGFFAVPAIGLEATLYVLVILHAGLAMLALLTAAGSSLPARLSSLVACVAVVVALLVLRPSIELPFLLDGWNDGSRAIVEGPASYDRSQLLFLREGRNTTVSVVERDGTLRLFNDGRPESGIGRGTPTFGPELVMLGGMPALLAGERERAMVIGLGAGHSTTMLLAGGFARVDVVELESAVLDAARTIHRMRGVPFPLDDRRAHWVVDDARARLALAAPGSYDAIVSQPSHPWLSGVSALYTREFFEEARRALKPGGVVSLWANVFRMDLPRLRAIVATLRGVFPHVAAFVVEDSSFLLVASDRPLALGERITTRFSSAPKLREFFAGYRMDTTAEVLATMELDEAGVARFARGGEILVDDRPTLEYALSTLPHDQSLTERDLDRAFARIPWMTARTQAGLPEHLRQSLPLYRLSRLETRRVGTLRVARALPGLTIDASHRELLAGAVQETLGNVSGALVAYDASSDPDAASRADALRLVDGSPWQALAIARARATTPADPTSLLRAALATRRPADLDFALAVERLVPHAAEGVYRSLTTAIHEGGCPAALRLELADASLDPTALFTLLTCAIERGDDVRVEALAEAWASDRRALAQVWSDRGSKAADGGNYALAARFHRRALRLWPAHRDSAEHLAEALCAMDRCAEAGPILDSAIDALRFASGQDAPLREAATRLGVSLMR